MRKSQQVRLVWLIPEYTFLTPKYFPKYIDELACVALLGGGLGVWYVTSGTTESAPTAQTTPNIRNRLLPISSIALNNLTEGMFGK